MDIDGGTIATTVTALGLGTALGAWVKSKIARTQTTDTKLWAWVGRLQEEAREERAKCDARIAAIEARADSAEARAAAADERAEAAEKHAEKLARELVEMRQAIGMRRDDDTNPGGIRKR